MSGLRVAIDTGPMLGARTGIGQFTAHLVDALARLPRSSDGPAPPVVVPYVLSGRATLPPGTRRLPYPARVALELWGRGDHPRARRSLRGVDVVHGTNFVVPPTGWPTVVTVHDCSPITRPALVDPVVRSFIPVLRRAIASGAYVHVPSAFVGDEVHALLGAPRERIRVIHHGAPEVGAQVTGGAPVLPSALALLDGRPFVLALATREPRKNLVTLVRAFDHVARLLPDVMLVLVGPSGSDDDAINAAVDALDMSTRERVVTHGFVGESARTALLARASVLAYPSLDEGFGLPMIEAMAAGVPVVAARAGALVEVAGDAAELIDPLDIDALGAALVRVLTDASHRSALIDAGFVNARGFSWAASAAAMVELYRDAIMATSRSASAAASLAASATRRPASR